MVNLETCRQHDGPAWTEADRIDALRGYHVLDTAPERSFDDLARLAALICGAPAATVTLVDERRQWVKAAVGTEVRETPRELSICSVAIRNGGVFIVPDTRMDARFCENPSVVGPPHIRFYAGAVLETASGFPLGTLCVWDHEPRPGGLSQAQSDALSALARVVLDQLAMRNVNADLRDSLAENRRKTLLLDAALAKLHKGVCFFDGNHRLIACNDRYKAIYGLTADQTRAGTTAREIIRHLYGGENHPNVSQADFIRMVEARAAEREPTDSVVKLTNDRTIAIHYEPMPDGGWLATHEDLTDELKAANRIRTAEERFRLAARATRDVIWDWDLVTDAVEVGQAVHETFGYAEGQFGASGEWWVAAMHPDDRGHADGSLRNAISSGAATWQGRYRFRRGDGSYAEVFDRGCILRDASGVAVRVVGAMQDISERMSAERTLRDGEERLRLALNAGRMFAWDRDLDVDFARRSEGAMSMLGIGSGPTSDLLDKVHPDDLALVKSNFARPLDKRRDFEFRCFRPDGQIMWLSLRAERSSTNRLTGIAMDVTERKSAEAAMRQLADEDSLTSLPNRRRFSEQFDKTLRQATASGTQVSLLVVDLDDFKDVNDTFGHHAGDALLQETARRLLELLPKYGAVARLGGDEFAILFADPFNPEGALGFAQRVVQAIGVPFAFEGRLIASNVSIGLATFPRDEGDQPGLLKAADLALYGAKAAGRGKVMPFDPRMRVAAEERVAVLTQVREGLKADEFVPFYQPKISLSTGCIVGFEALARWEHPSRGILTPGYFGPAFAHAELSELIGQVMLRKVTTDMSAWLGRSLDFGRIALNFSSSEFARSDLAETVLATLAECGIPIEKFEVEVTEGVFLGASVGNVRGILDRCKQAGIAIALDDFGTGFASLTHLKQYPVDHIKIDRSFVQGLGQERGDTAIVSSVLSLAENFEMEVTAEGVETEAQAQLLSRMGCGIGQGYLFGKPMPGSRLPWFVENWKGWTPDAGVSPTRVRQAANG